MNSKKLFFITFIIVSSIWIDPVFAISRTKKDELIKRKYTYSTLSAYEKQLFDEYLNDELAGHSDTVGAILTEEASLRNKTRTAEALLFRNLPGDKENAEIILDWILQNQYQDPESKVYGVWKTGLKNDRLDQNWREFIGCDLIIVYKKYAEILSPALLDRIKTGLIHAAKGAQIRNVSADYTNISIMSAFLMDFVGSEFDLIDNRNAGLKKAKDIYALYQKNKTFSEFNSPTYYGVTLLGLALWREMASSIELRIMGKELESALWEEISSTYSPNLKNLPGPYFRAYGMDMNEYFSITGIWIALALNNPDQAPLPAFHSPKYGEMSNFISILNLGLSLPASSLNLLKSIKKDKLIKQDVYNSYNGDKLKKVSIFISENWMMGGLWGNLRMWNQIKTGTIHWENQDGKINWLMILGDGKLNIKVNKNEMNVYASKNVKEHFEIYVYSNNTTNDKFIGNLWHLNKMDLGIKTTLPNPTITRLPAKEIYHKLAISEAYQEVFEIKFQVPSQFDIEKPLLVIYPKIKQDIDEIDK